MIFALSSLIYSKAFDIIMQERMSRACAPDIIDACIDNKINGRGPGTEPRDTPQVACPMKCRRHIYIL